MTVRKLLLAGALAWLVKWFFSPRPQVDPTWDLPRPPRIDERPAASPLPPQ